MYYLFIFDIDLDIVLEQPHFNDMLVLLLQIHPIFFCAQLHFGLIYFMARPA